MKKVATFQKVSLEQYTKDCVAATVPVKSLKDAYEAITIPKRATKGSAGYDFCAPYDIDIPRGGTVLIPTGIRAKINDGWFLMLVPRSGLGFKYRVRLENTVGIIDSDYYGSDNEGHIMVKMTYCKGRKHKTPLEKMIKTVKTFLGKPSAPAENDVLHIEAGKAFCQGIFTLHGVTTDEEEVTTVRNGGEGSTDTQ